MSDDRVTLTIPAFTVPAEDAGAYDRACDAIERVHAKAGLDVTVLDDLLAEARAYVERNRV